MRDAKASLLTGVLTTILLSLPIMACLMLRPYDATVIAYNLDIPPVASTFVLPAGHHKQVKCLASAIYYESRGEPKRAQIGVAEVTINRVENDEYPSTICSVVYSGGARGTCAYTWTCQHHTVTDIDSWYKALDLANNVYQNYYLSKTLPDHTHGALYFLSGHANPIWKHDLRTTMKSGHMVFLAER